MVQTLQQNLRGLSADEYEVLRSLSHLSKNLYNKTLYEVRQHYFDNGEYLNYYDAYDQLKTNWNYEVLPSQVAQQTMKQVDRGFKSFFNLVEKKRENKYDADVSPHRTCRKTGSTRSNIRRSRFRSKTTTFDSAFRERTATSSTAT